MEFAPCRSPCRHLTRPWQCDSHKTRNTTRLKCCACHAQTRITSKVLAVTKTGAHLLKTSRKYCACHTKRLSKGYETRLNVTKCHTCYAKRSNATSATSKGDPFCRTYHRHGHTPPPPGRLQTVADGCKRLRTVADGCGRKRNVERTHPQPPDPQSETGTLATHSGKKNMIETDADFKVHQSSPCFSRCQVMMLIGLRFWCTMSKALNANLFKDFA